MASGEVSVRHAHSATPSTKRVTTTPCRFAKAKDNRRSAATLSSIRHLPHWLTALAESARPEAESQQGEALGLASPAVPVHPATARLAAATASPLLLSSAYADRSLAGRVDPFRSHPGPRVPEAWAAAWGHGRATAGSARAYRLF